MENRGERSPVGSVSKEQVQIERLASVKKRDEDDRVDTLAPGIRPHTFDDYPGQESVKENLRIYVAASKRRGEPLDHLLLHGPPGLGKTTLAQIVANELGVPFVSTSGPAIDKPGDLAGILSSLQPGTLLFIDEIHRLSIKVEEILYSAMEDFAIDMMIGQGPSARAVRMDVAPFTLAGATTRVSLLSRPLLGRFGIQERLEFYSEIALCKILRRSASILGMQIEEAGAMEIASRSRGTPRLANRLLRRVWDFAEVYGSGVVTSQIAGDALLRQGMDPCGLDRVDRMILKTVYHQYDGGPVGIETLAATLNEDRSTLEEVYEPYLVHRGFLARGPRGRYLTDTGRKHVENSGSTGWEQDGI
ncbi:Holliday junction branch migration DNA helicase RuvB [bacterium]|nr:Holliday junction branch migration DNA helicase RuvB [bacterium]